MTASGTSSPPAVPESPAPERRTNPWLILTVLCIGFFIILLDTTIVNIAVPALTADLHAVLTQVLWIVNAYTLVYAGLLITGGRLGDLYGHKRLFLLGLTVFVLASAACGLATGPAMLIATRALQGVGGALLTPQTLAILTVTFRADRRGTAFGIWGAVAGLATVTGPTFGGWLVTELGWRWIFWVNLPIGVTAGLLALRYLPGPRRTAPARDPAPARGPAPIGTRPRLDWTGTVLASLGLFLICAGLIEGPSHHWGTLWGPVSIPALVGAGVVVVLVFAWQQRRDRDREPLVPAGIYADRNFAVMSGVIAAISFGMLGLFLPLVIFLQSVLQLSAWQAGLILAPMSLASVASAPVAGRMADRAAAKDALIAGLVLWAGGIGIVLWATRLYYDRDQLIIGLVVAGVGLGMTFAPLQSIAMRNVRPRMAGSAAGLINTSRQLGAVFGSAATGALLQTQLAARLMPAAQQDVQALPLSFQQPLLDGFEKAAHGIQGLEVGAGEAGAHLPADLPSTVRPAIEQVAVKTFQDAYIPAMRVTLLVPVVVLALALIGAAFVRPVDPEPVDGEPTDAAPGE